MGLKEDVNRTIEYAAKFKSWVNDNEISERLISGKIYTNKELNQWKKDQTRINKRNKYYEIKLEKAKEMAKKIELNFKDILFLGISGSVASGHPKRDDDIDFFVITRSNKLWKNRLKIRWWVYINKIPHRKYNRSEKKDEFCFNLWLDEKHLLIPKTKQNLKNSVDLVLVKPLINKNNTYEKFLLANNWVKKWVATPYFNKVQDVRSNILDKKVEQNNFDKVMNYLYFWPQYWYMKNKIGKELISLHQAFFHS